ncbi:hypothetical protein NPIL_444521 [Nephila pilipes]|uniref:Uncharacterized protein n=1 Tax=Nephila pilipes TaxID=299642 RepID=A0A8X6P482_NEPPI|nr:hypothetical protein NPIL_444521 [Nephila pilipes]
MCRKFCILILNSQQRDIVFLCSHNRGSAQPYKVTEGNCWRKMGQLVSFKASVAQEFLDDIGDVDGEVDIMEDRGCRFFCSRRCIPQGKKPVCIRGRCFCFKRK